MVWRWFGVGLDVDKGILWCGVWEEGYGCVSCEVRVGLGVALGPWGVSGAKPYDANLLSELCFCPLVLSSFFLHSGACLLTYWRACLLAGWFAC